MTSNAIRYQYAKLLIFAAVALATNPVWHALGHELSGHHSHEIEEGVNIQWTTEDLCPYCDAVFQHAITGQSEIRIGVLGLLCDIQPLYVDYTDQCLLLSTRPRAPPVMV